MSRLVIAVLASFFAASALAQDSAGKMSKDELLSFLPGTKVTHTAASTGSLRYWTNEPDGKFVASSNNKGGSALGTQGATAGGTWTINDAGKYCVEINWRTLDEKWCATVLKGTGGVYYLNVADAKHQIEFAK